MVLVKVPVANSTSEELISATPVINLDADGKVVDFATGGGDPPAYDSTTDSDKVTLLNDGLLQRYSVQTVLDAVTATGDSTESNLTNFNKAVIQISKTGTATVDIKQSLDNSNYDVVLSDQDGWVELEGYLGYIIVEVSAYTSGSVTAKIAGGN